MAHKPTVDFTGMHVVVLGAPIMDWIIPYDRYQAGEFDILNLRPGGKGFHMALAASRLGATVHMIGAVGNDTSGSSIVETLNDNGIDTTGVGFEDSPTPFSIVLAREAGPSYIGMATNTQLALNDRFVREA